MSVCDCGHVNRMHAPSCTACGCSRFVPAADPDTATEAARARLSTEQQLLATARRALAMKHYDEALGACLALLNETKETR